MKLKKILPLLALVIAFFLIKGFIYNSLYPLKYESYIYEYSKEYNVDPYLVMAMIKTESKFDRYAVSQQGAMGLMQITKTTSKWIAKLTDDTDFEVNDLYDPETNIKMGVFYISNLMDEFDTTELALAAYNAGSGTVTGWLKSADVSSDGKTLNYIPYAETSNYLKKVQNDERIYRLLYKAK
jgi:Soluble lytic murein transglycosylase and related regulatory proteins (some contain LysM/invasin domains)